MERSINLFIPIGVLLLTLVPGLAAGADAATPAADTVASADGTSISYDSVGESEPALVFVHCWTCNRGFWEAQVAHFAGRYRVVRLDLAGHGSSAMGRKDYTIAAFADDVLAVVNKLGLQRIVLIGHSMGGPVVLQAHKALGTRVIGVVAVDAFNTGFKVAAGGKQTSDDSAGTFEQDFPGSGKKSARTMFAPSTAAALVERISTGMAAADRSMAASALRGTFEWYQRESASAFQRVGARLRNINGDPNGGNRPTHPSVVLIAGAAHFPAQEKPAEFNRALETIVEQFVDSAGTY